MSLDRDCHARQPALPGAFAAGADGIAAATALTPNPDPAIRLRDRVMA